jgi:hypothetical protein
MVKVTIEVRSGAAHFRVGVRAQSIQRALSLVGGRFPGRRCRVEFPIKPEGYFAAGHSARAGTVELPKEMAT